MKFHELEKITVPSYMSISSIFMVPKDRKIGTGRPRKSWSDMLIDTHNIEMIWRDYVEIADNWAVWKGCVSQCVPRTRGRPT